MNRTEYLLALVLALGLVLGACKEDECVCDDDAGDDDTSTPDDDASDDDVTGDDVDGDGFTVEMGDCDDNDAAVHPAADEGCGDGVDSDCDGVEDSGCTVDIPSGEALIGSNEVSVIIPGQFISYWDERPEHEVAFDDFHIDLYEVTVFQFRRCVADGDCDAPDSPASATREDYFDNPEYGGYPVIGITWDQAKDYCEWRGGRLPTEAEWEKAAKGPSPNAHTAPWGYLEEQVDWIEDCDKGNYGLCLPDTARIGSYPDGVSHYGLFDMCGNAMEWVADWYHTGYYTESPAENPTGPTSGRFRALRGGSWNTGWYDGRVVRRRFTDPDHVNDSIGVRCVFDGLK